MILASSNKLLGRLLPGFTVTWTFPKVLEFRLETGSGVRF